MQISKLSLNQPAELGKGLCVCSICGRELGLGSLHTITFCQQLFGSQETLQGQLTALPPLVPHQHISCSATVQLWAPSEVQASPLEEPSVSLLKLDKMK